MSRTRIGLSVITVALLVLFSTNFGPQVFPTFVDHSRTPSQHILAAHFTKIDVYTTDTSTNSILWGLRDTFDMRLFHFDDSITVSDARWAIHDAGYQPATVIELVAFVTQHPSACEHKRIVALREWNHGEGKYPMIGYEDRRIWTMVPPKKIWHDPNVYSEEPDPLDLNSYYLGVKPQTE
ncbi:MAG: hypothetical protein HZC01_01570 [Candidatus Kerfeldbacteria bacterium]|nr:hypothetical protein [Candidatus Kerfeldbacteria bacterium]